MSLDKQPGKQKLDAGGKGPLLPGHPLCQPRSIGGRREVGENKTSALPSDRKWRGRTWWIKSMKAIQASAPFSRSVIAENVKIGRNDSLLDLGCEKTWLDRVFVVDASRYRSPLSFFSPSPVLHTFPLYLRAISKIARATQFSNSSGISDHDG